jgi:S-adenosylmethionine:tRNA ribosyltransferase-isomerase
MRLSDFQYDLPRELIAQKPLLSRDRSRLMVVDRSTGTISERPFRGIKDYLAPGDCMVMNDTKVVPVRLYGKRDTGGKVEIFILDPWEEENTALVRPSKRIKPGERVKLDGGYEVVVGPREGKARRVRFNAPLEEVLRTGHIPLPPYISREDDARDRHDYQTVYARKKGATAAPTAGLHFTEELLSDISGKGVLLEHVTLHTGYGTFAPVKEKRIEDHTMHSEYYELSAGSAERINSARERGHNVVSIGTTSTRVLESAADDEGVLEPRSGRTNLFIYPGYKFKIIDRLLTNFHLPGSTLLMLVSAFAGRDLILEAYRKAVERRFRFFSYGDAMFII